MAAGAPVMQWLCVGIVAGSVAAVPSTVLISAGRASWAGLANVAEWPLYVALTFTLTWRWGAAGAGAACAIRSIADAAVMFQLGARSLDRMPVSQLSLPAGQWALVGLSLAIALGLGRVEPRAAGLAAGLPGFALLSVWLWARVLEAPDRATSRGAAATTAAGAGVMRPVDKEPRRLTVVNIVEEGRYGGPQQRIAGVAARLQADHGIDTVVVLPAAGSDRFQQVLRVAGVQSRVIQLHRLTRDVVHLAGYLFFFVSEVRAIRSVIRSVRPDVVHCNGSWQVKGMIAAWLAGVRRVWHLNDTFMPAMVRPLFRVVYKMCPPDGVVASSRRTLQVRLRGRPKSAAGDLGHCAAG